MKNSVLKLLGLQYFIILLSANQVCAEPLEKLFSEDGTMFVEISPDGNRFASLLHLENKQVINVSEVGSDRVLLSYSPSLKSKKAYITDYDWIDSRYVFVKLSNEIGGVGNLLESKRVGSLIFIDTLNPKSKPKVLRTSGNLLDPLPKEKGKILFETSGLVSRIYKIDVEKLSELGQKRSKLDLIDGGQFKSTNQVIEIKARVVSWFVNSDGYPFSALSINRDRVFSLKEKDSSGQFIEIANWNFGEWYDAKDKKEFEFFVPYRKAGADGEYYVVDFNDEPLSKIYLENYRTKSRKKVFDSGGYKILGVVMSEQNELMAVRVVANDKVEYFYVDGELIDTEGNKNSVSISHAIERDRDVALTSSYDFPGEFIYRDHDKGDVTTLGYRNAKIRKPLGTAQKYGLLDNDGVEVSYILNTPQKITSPIPLIVMPHGGPFGVYDTPYYDREVQYFVKNDFAVLRVNYRGSGGKGTEFEELGKKQYGEGMLNDIMKTTQFVLTDKRFDSERVCIFGMSYGGYAATMLTIKYPDLFVCGVSFAGVYDVALFINEKSDRKKRKTWFIEHIADPKTEYDYLKSISPLYLVNKLNNPMLVMHGDEDTRVSAEHFYRLQTMSNKESSTAKFKLFSGMGHSFASASELQKVLEEAKVFILESIAKASK